MPYTYVYPTSIITFYFYTLAQVSNSHLLFKGTPTLAYGISTNKHTLKIIIRKQLSSVSKICNIKLSYYLTLLNVKRTNRN